MKKLLQAAALLAALHLAGSVHAQDIQVSSPNWTDMSSIPSLSPINGNDFGSVGTTGFKIYPFTIFNHDPDTDLTIGDITLTGANADQFDVFTDYDSAVAPFGETTVYIEFNPSSVGIKLATVNIPNNDPDLNGSLTFTVRGTGVTQTPELPNLRAFSLDAPKLKFVKQSNSDYILSGVFYIENNTNAVVENVEVNVYTSFDRMYQDSDPLRSTFNIAKLPASKEGKAAKVKKVKYSFQFTFAQQSDIPRYLFIEALPQQGDAQAAGNRTRITGIDPLGL